MRHTVLLLLVAVAASSASAQAPSDSALRHSVEQLRTSVGHWDVLTDFLNEDGSVARSEAGTYTFEWVVPDRVIRGQSEIPGMGQVSAILFYVNEAKQVIEMVSVAADGNLWVMSGPLGGETRTTPAFKTAAGEARLRFTRFNVKADSFESRMEYTEDGGKTWKQGNHQRFTRAR